VRSLRAVTPTASGRRSVSPSGGFRPESASTVFSPLHSRPATPERGGGSSDDDSDELHTESDDEAPVPTSAELNAMTEAAMQGRARRILRKQDSMKSKSARKVGAPVHVDSP
jgi:hypothetical protein